jgi:hypothetical protein
MPSIMKLLVEEVKKLISFSPCNKRVVDRSDLSSMSFHVCEVMRIDRREKLFFASPHGSGR